MRHKKTQHKGSIPTHTTVSRPKGRTQKITVSDLNMHPHEQHSRISDAALTDLENDIRTSGYIAIPTVKMHEGRWVIVDGNRRWMIAKRIGYTELECYVIEDGDIDVLFAKFNAHARLMRGFERLNFLSMLPDKKWETVLAEWPKSFRGQIDRLEKATSREYVVELGRKGKTGPGVILYAETLDAALDSKRVKIDLGTIIRWMVEHKMQNKMNNICRRDGGIRMREAHAIAARIRLNKPYLGGKRILTIKE